MVCILYRKSRLLADVERRWRSPLFVSNFLL